MSTEDTNKRLWGEAQRKFQSNVVDKLKAADTADTDAENARHSTLLEVLAIVEAALEDARHTPDNGYATETLEMLLEQITGLMKFR